MQILLQVDEKVCNAILFYNFILINFFSIENLACGVAPYQYTKETGFPIKEGGSVCRRKQNHRHLDLLEVFILTVININFSIAII